MCCAGASIIPEQEFAAKYPNPITVQISVPASDNAAATSFTISISVTKLVKDLKEMIVDRVGLAPNKQQIKYQAGFLKDAQSLASANVWDNSVVEVIGRSRGGKR